MPVIRERFGAKKEWSVGPGANLRGANFRGVDLRGINLSGADLTDAIFNEADLTGARLDRAILCNAILFRTVLTGTSAVGADFRGAVLRESDLHGADLSDSLIDDGECEAAYGSVSTKLPSGRSVILTNRPDDPRLGVSRWGGGYRSLRQALDDNAPGQPLIAEGTHATKEISEELRADLMASLVRVLDEAIQLSACAVSRENAEAEIPSRILWYGSDCADRGTPYEFSGLADFLVLHLDIRLEALHSDGSVDAIFRLAEDVIASLTKHVLVAEHESFFSEDVDDTEVTEIDITLSSLSQFLPKLESFFDSGFESATRYRFFIKPSRRKFLIATVEYGLNDILQIEVAKSQYGQEIAESLWSEFEGIGDDPKAVSVAESGWTLEIELEADNSDGAETQPIDDDVLREVRDIYKPIAISQCGSIVGFETWEDGLVMAKIALSSDTAVQASVVGPSLTDREGLQALLDEAISAYVLTRDLTDVDLSNDDSNDEETDDPEDLAEVDEEFEDEFEDDDGTDDEVENDSNDATIYDDDVQEEFAEFIRVLGAAKPAVASIWETPQFEFVTGGVLDVEMFDVPDTRWKYMLDAAKRGDLYLRSCGGLINALGILELEKLDSYTFKVRMKPCTDRRFHLNYEWIPPSQWR